MTPPVFAHGHLRLYLLSLLAEQPQHGYELIQALGDRFGGTYVPSAGTIYPRLAKLQEEGLVTKESDGRRTVYAITDAGRAELAARGDELDAIETDLTDSVRRLADEVRSSVDDAMRSLRADLAAAAREARTAPHPSGVRVDHDSAPASSADAETRTAARARLQEADAALATFRAELRSELRSQAANGTLALDAVDLLITRLDEVLREVTGALRR
ncbi:PadR family transcriptional regulator [Protaetiibacter mangrovi]|uniref:PadR family transcriptional regulator n=1 Tax=Protaetiibacter mangrovi TaxID=2970926 RepID=A0ABT1ZCL1_9MICO|nr:PadR family transcriptional regulator [Protaetiibacter mangrovi]MCS0498446.1 PadR family transcriptional regulator [Protaetiibacter mangrovi]TPX04141.1 helix-turn-helix transcriptional regulator [Schumannella luteola]